jgi:hypothetical protein
MKSKKLRNSMVLRACLAPLRFSGSRLHSQIPSFRSHLIFGYEAVFAFNFRTDTNVSEQSRAGRAARTRKRACAGT